MGLNTMEQTALQLNEYRIIEGVNGLLWWEAHFGLGQQRSGRCLIHDDVLVIGEFMCEENGFLKREFLDRLEKLPLWKMTTYYCMASELFDVSSRRSLHLCRSAHLPWIPGEKRSHKQTLKEEAPGTFRVDKYAVTVTGDMEISWQAWEGIDSVVGGRCFIKSGILFLGIKEYANGGQDKHKFLNSFRELAPWTRTKVWSHSLAIRPCEPPLETGHSNAMVQRGPWREDRDTGNPTSTLWKASQKTLKSLWASNSKFKISSSAFQLFSKLKLRKPSQFPRGLRKICFVILIPLLLVGILFGLILGRRSVEETSQHDHSSQERHHR
jgi:hypothetical protein